MFFLSFLKDDHHGGDDGDVDIATFSHVRDVAAIKVIMMRRMYHFFFPFSLHFLLFFSSSFFLKDDHHGGDGGDDDVNSENYDCFEDARECNIAKRVEITKKHVDIN